MLGGRHEAGALQSLSTESGHYRSADQISRSGHSSRLLRIRSLPVDPQVTKGRQAISTKGFALSLQSRFESAFDSPRSIPS
jgi:hypothetical protein